MKCAASLLVLSLACCSPFANVGGIFYNRTITGLSIDTGTTIISAETFIDCKDSLCSFKSVYRVNTANCDFQGRFYGMRFENIRVNNEMLNETVIRADTVKSDSAIFAREWVLNLSWDKERLLSIPIHARIQADSTLTIEGQLSPLQSQNWGLAALPTMSAPRHLWLQKPVEFNNEYVVCYVLAPIQSFKGLQKVTVHFNGNNVELIKRIRHRQMTKIDYNPLEKDDPEFARHFIQDKKTTDELANKSSDSIVFTGNIPDAVEYFYKIAGIPAQKTPLFSPGGPVVFLGETKSRFYSEIGWELSVNPWRFVSFLPSVFASYNAMGHFDWSAGLRVYCNGLSIGVISRKVQTVELSVGWDIFGPVGIEIRRNTFLAKVSI
jgi:hypothetical protein